jgi:hypothetical protein
MWESMPISGQEVGTMQTSARKDGMKVGVLLLRLVQSP